MAIKRLGNKPTQSLSTEQKIAFALLMFLGIGGILFGFQSFGANLSRPIQLQIAEYYTGKEYLSTDERETKEREEAKNKDTDKDGISDYDELYIYKTSPYLTDSDSDGFDDKAEVFSGNDPNCPTGRDCGPGGQEEVGKKDNLKGLVEGIGSGGNKILESGQMELENAQDIESLFRDATIAEIREALMATGISEEQLSEIEDDQLQEMFFGAIDDASDAGAFDTLAGDDVNLQELGAGN